MVELETRRSLGSLGIHQGAVVKINCGCGRQVLDGWINVDAVASPLAKRPPDILCDVRSIPLEDAVADQLMAIHVWEHFYRWDCDTVIAEWRRLLKVGGLLILEMPDLFKYCANILEGRSGKHVDQLGMWGMFGDPRDEDVYMAHHWGWTFATIEPFLRENGFENVLELPTQWHPCGRTNRDFRVEAIKA